MLSVVIKLEIMTAHKIANPSIQAVSLWSTSTIISTTFNYFKILIETKAATIKILSVKSSQASIKSKNTDFRGFAFLLFDPKASVLLLIESVLIPDLWLDIKSSTILELPN